MFDVNVKGRAGTVDIAAEFSVSSGATCLFGRSGSGKTTLANMVSGFVQPDSGWIEVEGVRLFDSSKAIDAPTRQRRIGYVFQEPRLFPHLSVRSNLTYSRWAGRRTVSRSLDEVVSLLGLEKLLDRKPTHLSGGEKQRIAIGRALLSDPRLLIMDEPLASLDYQRKDEILPYLDRICREADLSVLYISHSLEEVTRLAKNLVLMEDGKTTAFGTVAEVLAGAGIEKDGFHRRSLIEGKVSHVDPEFGLVHVGIGAGEVLQIAAPDLNAGDHLRLSVSDRDISIAVKRPEGVSIRNVVQAKLRSIEMTASPHVDVLCQIGDHELRARITRASLHDLGLKPEMEVFLMVKSVSIDEHSPSTPKGF
ncbi:MAG: molybdenum ABC transporter ATP-binding protein [Rhodobacteraceae bacterium]|nr:molybdenum ABC transporter ATP-binding protein [Paracoccaceae bacterium]